HKLGSGPYRCDECGKEFGRKSDLKTHRQTHDPSLRVRCEWPDCDREFKSRKYMLTHMNVHTMARPYRCPCQWTDCDFRCQLETTLKKHVLTTHEMVSDDQCSEVVSKRKTNECNLMDRRVKRPKK
ncbi:unnamed protein product, partial [Oppiella nova]